MSFPSRITPRDVARIVFRHWRMMALIFCSVMGLALLVVAIYPRSYASESKLIIRIGRESVGLDPTATTGETVMLQKTQEEEVNSALSLLTSREVLERVVERVGTERILDDLPSGDEESKSDAVATKAKGGSWIGGLLVTLGLSDPGTETDRAIRQLEKRTIVAAPKRSMVISIKYTAASPQLAHDVVKAMTDVFLQEHSRLSQMDGSLAFFSEQVDKLYSDLSAAQANLRDRKNEYQMTSVGNRLSILEKGNDAMRQKVYDLKILESDLMSRYTDEYPPLKEVRRQRELAEQSLMRSTPNVASLANESSDRNAGIQTQPRVSPASYQVSPSYIAQQDKLSAELQTLNDQEYELAQFDREVKLLEIKYAMHVEKLEQARVNEALGREQITNVKVAQPASLVYKPVKPNKMLLAVGALMVAVIGSIGSALVAEQVDQTLRTTDQVESQLGLPVLASLPYRTGHRKQRSSSGATLARNPSNGEKVSHDSFPRHSSYRGLVAALRSMGSNGQRHAKTVGFVGCGASKLRSRVAGNVAVEAAASGTDEVLLIDADARRRRVSKRFHVNGSAGWRDVLAGTAAVNSCVRQSEPSNLAVMGPGGTNGQLPTDDAGLSALAQCDEMKTEYGLVVVDLPTTCDLDGAPAFDGWIDEAVLVVEAERTRVQAAQRVKEMLALSGVQVIGVVLANRREYIPRWLYQRL